ncbi:DUF4393 domain-containing protein [Clostridium sp. CX1]|uniref:DUF4393 domain-containing protein n=1 Tax=Clostridium sp. CX1 TaxID=2978346 RepID=UPI0021BFA4F9|nr:DUF4393 domain-containing protein [Clostridium sp. CX1]MCT8976288.1 DUF4393 domain-containing protein [Clostridium sp. CX1]
MENSVKETASMVKDVAEAVKGVVEAVPVYQDLAQPALKEVGTALGTVGKTINVALAPLSALVWGYDKIKTYITNSLEQKLKNVPPERIISPAPEVAGPALEALRFAGHNENLRELYANLLATSMDSITAETAHPSFVEILKQLSPDEAKIMNLFSNDTNFPIISIKAINKETNHFGYMLKKLSTIPEQAACTTPKLGVSYLENLDRLGLIKIDLETFSTTDNFYTALENHPTTKSIFNIINSMNNRPEIQKGLVYRTSLGSQFYNACISQKR